MAGTRKSEGALWPNKGGADPGMARRGSGKVEAMERLRTVAVVEDEATIREAVCTALRREGYAADPFDDGLNAWQAFDAAFRMWRSSTSGSRGWMASNCAASCAACRKRFRSSS
jgi:hypothetical protein